MDHLGPTCPIIGLSWDLFWTLLDLFWATWGHLSLEPFWCLLGTKSFLKLPSKFARGAPSLSWAVVWPILDSNIGLSFYAFGVRFWTTFGQVWGTILGSLLEPNQNQKVDPVLERLLVAVWRHFTLGGFLAVLMLSWEARCSKTIEKKYETAIFKIADTLAHFGESSEPKLNRPQTPLKTGPKKVQEISNLLYTFWVNFRSTLGPKVAQKDTKIEITFGTW